MIHETAMVDPEAELGSGVRIGPYAIVEAEVVLGNGCELDAHAIVKSGSTLGSGCRVGHFAVVGGEPQITGFDRSLKTGVTIGPYSSVRESATIHRSAFEGKCTEVGSGTLLMVGSHVGHDCQVGSDVVVANAALLAGHVVIGDHVFVGGGAAFHQFVRVGESAMVGGLAIVSKDVPPFLTVAERNLACGPNLLGLRRRGFSSETLSEIKFLYRRLFMQKGNPSALALEVAASSNCPKSQEGRRFLDFFSHGKRGFVSSRNRGRGS